MSQQGDRSGIDLHSMSSGDSMDLSVNNYPYSVRYDSRQSYGDDNRPVRGAEVGEYTVTHPNGGVTTHPHGPHALTEQARKRGANPNAKGWAARQAWAAISASASRNRRA